MRRIILAAVALLAAHGAWAQSYNPQTLGGLGGANTSLSNVTLPAALNNLTANLNGQVFYAKAYGSCVWDATHDVVPCINSAITAANAVGGGLVVVPVGTFGLATSVALQSQVVVHGGGCGAYGQCATTLTAIGGFAGPMVAGQTSATTSQLSYTGIAFLSLDGATTAADGIDLYSTTWGIFEHLNIKRITTRGMYLQPAAGASPNAQVAFNTFNQNYIDLSDASSLTAKGIVIGAGTATDDTNRNTFNGGIILNQNGTGLEIGNADGNTFYGMNIQPVGGGTGKSVDFLGSSASAGQTARGNFFYSLVAGGGLLGGVYAEAGTFPSGGAEANMIFGLKKGDGEPAPNIAGGAVLHYEDDNGFTTLSQPVINVTARGAKCDGVTDDIVAFNSAIAAAAAAGGGTIVLPNGKTCAVGSSIVLGNGRQRSTTITANGSGGQTSLTVASIAGINNGDSVVLALDSGLAYTGTVNGVPSGNTVTITPALGGGGVVATSGNILYTGLISSYNGVGILGWGGCTDAIPRDVSTLKYIGAAAPTTTLTANAVLGALTLTVASTTGMVLGGPIGITLDNGRVWWTTLAQSPQSATAVAILNEVPSLATSGNTVTIANNPVLKVSGPIVAPFVTGVCIDANHLASIGLEVLHASGGSFQGPHGVVTRYYTGIGAFLHSTSAYLGVSEGSDDNMYNLFEINPDNGHTIGQWMLGSAAMNVAFSRNTFNGGWSTPGGLDVTAAGMREEFADNNTFIKAYTGSSGGFGTAGAGLYRQPPYNRSSPANNVFLSPALLGGVTDGTATGAAHLNDIFLNYSIDDGEPAPTGAESGMIGGNTFRLNGIGVGSTAKYYTGYGNGTYIFGVGRGATSGNGMKLESNTDFGFYVNAGSTLDSGTLALSLDSSGRLGLGGLYGNFRATIRNASGAGQPLALQNSDFAVGTTGTELGFAFGATSGNTYSRIFSLTTGEGAWGNLTLQDGGGHVMIGTTTDCGQVLCVNGSTNSNNFVPTSSTAPTVGMALPAAGKLGLYGTTSELFSGATDVLDYGVTTASVLTLPVATTLSNASVAMPGLASSAAALDAACWNAGSSPVGILTHNAAGALCSASLEEMKDISGEIVPSEALAEVMALKPIWAKFKDDITTTSDHAVHPMFGAHQVESIDPRLAAYDGDGHLLSVEYLYMSALNTAAIQALKADFDAYKAAHP